jgi:hypothetical protein
MMDGAGHNDGNIAEIMTEIGRKARDAARHLAKANTMTKNAALMAAADSIGSHGNEIKAANAERLLRARRSPHRSRRGRARRGTATDGPVARRPAPHRRRRS